MKTFEAIEVDSRGIFEKKPAPLVATSRDRFRIGASIEGLKKDFVVKHSLIGRDFVKSHDRDLEVVTADQNQLRVKVAEKQGNLGDLDHTWKCLELCQSILSNISHEYHGLLDRLKPFIWLHNSELIQVSKKNLELASFIKDNIGQLSSPGGLIPARQLTFKLLQSMSLMMDKCEKEVMNKDAIIDGRQQLTR